MNSAAQGNLFDSEKREKEKGKMGTCAPTLDELLKLYDANWTGDWFESKRQREEYYARGKETLKKFYDSCKDSWNIPVSLEKKFTISLSSAYHITGKIDRVDQLSDGSLQIIDYKTGAAKETVTGDDKDQLLLYQLAVLRTPFYKHLGAPSTLTYYYIVDGTQTSFLGTEKELAAFEKKMIETIDRIRGTDFTAITRADACGRCEFCRVSEFRV